MLFLSRLYKSFEGSVYQYSRAVYVVLVAFMHVVTAMFLVINHWSSFKHRGWGLYYAFCVFSIYLAHISCAPILSVTLKARKCVSMHTTQLKHTSFESSIMLLFSLLSVCVCVQHCIFYFHVHVYLYVHRGCFNFRQYHRTHTHRHT